MNIIKFVTADHKYEFCHSIDSCVLLSKEKVA